MTKSLTDFTRKIPLTGVSFARKNIPNLMIFRHIKSMMLVHLCRECVYENISDYLLDNTRPWTGEK